jgi:hypothetical protein
MIGSTMDDTPRQKLFVNHNAMGGMANASPMPR